MTTWPKHPVILELNTWVWLGELSRKHERHIDLATVPPPEWDAIAESGFDGVWLMGVWERSPAGIAISMRNPGLLADFVRALPDFSPLDNVGSPVLRPALLGRILTSAGPPGSPWLDTCSASAGCA